MIFKKGFLLIFIRVLLIVALAIGLVYSYLETELSITPVMFGVLILILTIELSWRLHSQERNWASFLQSVQYGDFNRTYQHKTHSKELQEAFHLISEQMETLQTNREAEFRLLQTVLKHISSAVICYQQNGQVVFTNKAFNELLELVGLSQMDSLATDFPKIYQVLMAKESAPAEWIDHNNGQKLFVKTESFKLKGKALKITSLTDIRSSLEAKELESYQKLMRVMTHEIMNSTTPILSLIRVVNKKLINGPELIELNAKDQGNVAKSLNAIEERTSDMLKFVEAYKQINRPIQPHIEAIESQAFIESITSLMAPDPSIDFVIQDDVKGTLMLDRALMVQVLINLIKNATDALKGIEKPQLQVSLTQEAETINITVEDNGPGVPEHALQEIFVPFYTTKAEGSGIGLTLSRNIVRAHGGTLTYSRESGRTRFQVSLN
ncbi:sensor histidine kinase [Roseivirga sp.]|uniref:sensor histidine kinase n=1 Tax=Roseivirga sp. TaxID=1964215 RepID=UPI003B8E4E97